MPNTIPAAGEAMAKNRTFSVSIDLNRHNLKLLSMAELAVVMDGVTAARDAVNGVRCRPVCRGRAVDELDDIQDGLNECITMILEVAQDAAPSSVQEAEERAYLILHHDTWAKDDISLLVSQTLALAASVAVVAASEGAGK